MPKTTALKTTAPKDTSAMTEAAKQEPVVIALPLTAPAAPGLDQLTRIEEKAARIEEKFARYEAVLNRAEATLERSAKKVEDTARGLDFDGLNGELTKLNARINATPRFGALVITAIITAVVTLALVIIAAKFGLLAR
jgi:hypothetical protein